jgi:hypothetical protein
MTSFCPFFPGVGGNRPRWLRFSFGSAMSLFFLPAFEAVFMKLAL